jgi:hypothetical protein
MGSGGKAVAWLAFLYYYWYFGYLDTANAGSDPILKRSAYSLRLDVRKTLPKESGSFSCTSVGVLFFTVRGVSGNFRNIAVFGRSTVSTQPYLGTRDSRQIEARQHVLPTVYHVGGGRMGGGGRNASLERCLTKALGAPVRVPLRDASDRFMFFYCKRGNVFYCTERNHGSCKEAANTDVLLQVDPSPRGPRAALTRRRPS